MNRSWKKTAFKGDGYEKKKRSKNSTAWESPVDATVVKLMQRHGDEIRAVARVFGETLLTYGITALPKAGGEKQQYGVRFVFNNASLVPPDLTLLPPAIAGLPVTCNLRNTVRGDAAELMRTPMKRDL
jgi:hypothetical protein